MAESTFEMSIRNISMPGQCILIVKKDGKLDRGDNAYVQVQVPTDFAKHLMDLQKEVERLKALVPPEPATPWENDKLQFGRLIAELEGAGAFLNGQIMEDMKVSMDLEHGEVLEIVERATVYWDEEKLKAAPLPKKD